jgi:hypothetical protein
MRLFDWLWGKPQWCCAPFQRLFESRYERDLFVFARRLSVDAANGLSFWLAFRSIRQQDLARPICITPPDVPVTISTSLRILRCPWCGTLLEEFYAGRDGVLVDPVILQEFELPVNRSEPVTQTRTDNAN